jgi:predicted dehydrogenase
VSERFRLGIVGAGAIGRTHAEVASGLDDVHLAAVCDTRQEVAEELARRMGARVFARYEDLAADESLDGVILCTPPSTHPAIAKYLLTHGIDVLCEKPLAIDGLSAQTMYACAKRTGRLLMLASKFRYVEGVVAARELLHEGALGAVRHAEIVFSSNIDMRSRWNSDPEQSGGGVVIDNGSHGADLCRYLFGPVRSVAAVAYSRTPDLAVEDSAYLYLGAGEAGVTVDLSWSLDRKLPYFARIYCERGRIVVGWAETTLSRHPSIALTQIAPGYSKQAAFRAVHRDFIAASRGELRPRIGADDALASVEVIDAAYAAIRNGARAEVGAA